jgi:hypothetical protein
MIIKVGDKQRHVEIPEGYKIKKSGKLTKENMYLHLQKLVWDNIEEEDLQFDAADFDYVIERDYSSKKEAMDSILNDYELTNIEKEVLISSLK